MNFKDNRLRIMKYEPPRDIPVGGSFITNFFYKCMHISLINNTSLFFRISHVTDNAATTVMFYIASVHRKHFVYQDN